MAPWLLPNSLAELKPVCISSADCVAAGAWEAPKLRTIGAAAAADKVDCEGPKGRGRCVEDKGGRFEPATKYNVTHGAMRVWVLNANKSTCALSAVIIAAGTIAVLHVDSR